MQGAGGSLLSQCKKFWHINVDIDITGVSATFRQWRIIGYKLQMDFLQMETVIFDLHKATSCIFSNDLTPIICGRGFAVILHIRSLVSIF